MAEVEEQRQSQRIKALEDEVKVLKNEIKAVLLDIREQYLNWDNPFSGESRLDEMRIKTGSLGQETPSPITPKLDKEEKPSPALNGSEEDKEAWSNLSQSSEPQHQAAAPSKARSQRGDSEGSLLTAPIFKSSGVANRTDEERGDELSPTVPIFRPGNGGIKEQHGGKQNGKQNGANLATIAGLTEWVDQTTQRIGKQRTEAIVEGLYLMERLPPGIKDFLLKFVELSEAKEPQRQITTKDYLTVLAQIEGLLGQGSTSEMALVSILINGKGEGSG